MNTHKQFLEFDNKIALDDGKRDELTRQRKAIRDRIVQYCIDKGLQPKFYPQGSFPLRTSLNPIEQGEYDLDDGVYFITPAKDKQTPDKYHGHVRKAVHGHTHKIQDKDTCIRIFYADDGHHVDVPVYWQNSQGGLPEFAHKDKGYTPSDPEGFMKWVRDKTSKQPQLEHVIRYFKAWADQCEASNPGIKLPSGFVLTILACENLSSAPGRDDWAFFNTAIAIQGALEKAFECYRPTSPKDENVLQRYDAGTCLHHWAQLVASAEKARNASRLSDACDYWRGIFGDRFPKCNNSSKPVVPPPPPVETTANRPWAASI